MSTYTRTSNGTANIYNPSQAAGGGSYSVYGPVAAGRAGRHRVANTGTDGYVAYVGYGGPPDFTAGPDAFSPTLPINVSITPPVSGTLDLYVVTRRRNRYGLESQNQQTTIITIDSDGDEVLGSISAPQILDAITVEDDKFLIRALYPGKVTDANPADVWRVYVEKNTAPRPGIDTPVVTGTVLTTASACTVGPYTGGDVTYHVAVTVYRTEDGTESEAATATIVLSSAPAIPARLVGSFALKWATDTFSAIRAGLFDTKYSIPRRLAGLFDTKYTIARRLAGAHYVSGGFDLQFAKATGVSYGGFTTQENEPYGMFFSPDGANLYILGYQLRVYRYALSTPWNITTASYTGASCDISVKDTDPSSVYFRYDGKRMYLLGTANNRVSQGNMNVAAWNVGILSWVIGGDYTLTPGNAPYDLFFSAAGNKMYVLDNTARKVYQYTLAVAWAVNATNVSYDGVYLDVYAQTGIFTKGIFFNADGTKLYVLGSIPRRVYQYTLGTAWNVGTAVYDGISFAPGFTAIDMFFKPNGLNMYLLSGSEILEYSL